MKICFLTLGTRGDVQPYLALAKKIISLGHKAVICTSDSFQNLIENKGVEFKRASLDLMALSTTKEGKAVLEAPIKNIRLALKMSREVINPAYRKTFEDFYEAAQDCDVIVYHPKAFVAADIAMKLNIPVVSMPPVPITFPITEFPCIALSPNKKYGSTINKLTYLFNSKAENGYIKEINDFRISTLKLPKRKAGEYTYSTNHKEIPIVYPISKYLFEDVTSWNNHVELTGFFFLEAKERLTNEIEEFLSKGSKPITISFSSMPLKKPMEFINNLVLALKETSNRAIILVGNSGISMTSSKDILVLDQAPHTLLFPRSKAVIHHGGVGTTAAALLSGVPQLIIPFSVDQPFWAERVYRNGVSLMPIKEKDLSREILSKMLMQFEEKEICCKAKQFGEKIKAEDGLYNAANYILNLK